jgi:hypothetical protein
MIGVSSEMISNCSSRVKRLEITPVPHKYNLNYSAMITFKKAVILTYLCAPFQACLNTALPNSWDMLHSEQRWGSKQVNGHEKI